MNLKQVCILPVFGLFYFQLPAGAVAAGGRLVPSETYAVIAGVLHWKDTSLAAYSAENRKDAEFSKTLISIGVPASNITLLLDEQATKDAVLRALEETAKKAPSGSLFIFYYAGHGVNRGAAGRFLANYDLDTAFQFNGAIVLLYYFIYQRLAR